WDCRDKMAEVVLARTPRRKSGAAGRCHFGRFRCRPGNLVSIRARPTMVPSGPGAVRTPRFDPLEGFRPASLEHENGMAKKIPTPPPPTPPAVTVERAARLCKLVHCLGTGSQTRAALLRRLKIDVRGFYRDLEAIRAAGVEVTLSKGRYQLEASLDQALARLPFPDPHLTVAEARTLARGRSAAHRKLQNQLAQVLPEE